MKVSSFRNHWRKCVLLVTLCVTQTLFATPTLGGVVAWDTIQDIAGDSDVDTAGTLVYAYNFGASSGVNPVQTVTVQGVTFTAFAAPPFPVDNVNSITLGDVTLSETPGVLNGFDTSAGTGAFAALSDSYKGLLGTAIAPTIFATMTLTLGGLEVGKSYRFQAWVSDSSYTNDLFHRVLAESEGGSMDLKANRADAVGGLGQFTIGTFTATATTQEIWFVGMIDENEENQTSKNPILNAFQLRQEAGAVPEPASMVTFGLGALGIVYRARRWKAKGC